MAEISEAAKRAAMELAGIAWPLSEETVWEADSKTAMAQKRFAPVIQAAIDTALAAQAEEIERLRKAFTRLIRRAASMRLRNTPEWLGWFVDSLNDAAQAVGSEARFVYNKEADFIHASPTPTEASE